MFLQGRLAVGSSEHNTSSKKQAALRYECDINHLCSKKGCTRKVLVTYNQFLALMCFRRTFLGCVLGEPKDLGMGFVCK